MLASLPVDPDPVPYIPPTTAPAIYDQEVSGAGAVPPSGVGAVLPVIPLMNDMPP